jgi:prevent-host-death family protein
MIDREPTSVPATELRVHLGSVLRRIRKGEDIVIEKGGTPVAVVIDVTKYEQLREIERQHTPLRPQRVLASPAPDGPERLRRAMKTGWKGIDGEELKKRIRESRKISTRPPIKF